MMILNILKKGWINRNRILVNGKGVVVTLPLRKDPDHLSIKDRFLADTWNKDKDQLTVENTQKMVLVETLSIMVLYLF